MKTRKDFIIIGVDLAGVESRPTGVCLLRAFKAKTTLLYPDQEILGYIEDNEPQIVAVDAPLTLPPGRRSVQDRNQFHFRPCDLELKRRKIPFFPITLGPMRKLTERGIYLRHQLEKRGVEVIEVYPGGAQDVLGLLRAKHSLDKLGEGLKRLGLVDLRKGISAHELDAATAAYVGFLFLNGEAEIFGDSSSGVIIMPLALK